MALCNLKKCLQNIPCFISIKEYMCYIDDSSLFFKHVACVSVSDTAGYRQHSDMLS